MRWKSSMLLVVIIVATALITGSLALFGSRELPCNFLESINITDGIAYKNRTIVYDGIAFPYEQYAKINYVLENGSIHKLVAPYTRGCLCTIKPCVRLCCPPGNFVDFEAKSHCKAHEAAKDLIIDVFDERNRSSKTLITDRFAYVVDRPCRQFYSAEGEFKLTHTGNVYHSNRSFNHQSYCLQATHDEETLETDLDVLMCYTEDVQTRYRILPIGMLLSVPFIVATFLVYICLPELRNVHGKCLLCYLSGLASGYISLAMVQLNGSDYVEPLICKSVGYLIYFSFLSAFLWLSVISFDLWWSFRTMNGVKIFPDRKRFILYGIYAWGLALFLTLIAFILDSTESLPDMLQPGIGTTTCFMRKNRVSEFLFFYMPLAIITAINLIFFILTALKIHEVQRNLAQITAKEDSSRHQSNLKNDKDNFTLFLRLFIVMGVTWSMEALSWAIAPESEFFYLTDICNTIQGLVIFALFVMKKRVLRLLRKRWQSVFGKSLRNGSVDTNSTSAASRMGTSNLRLTNITTTSDKRDSKEV